MKGTLSNLFIFTAGAVVGAIVTLKLVQEKYDRLYHEEVESYRDMMREKLDEEIEEKTEETMERIGQTLKNATEKPDIRTYAAKIQKEGYTDYAKTGKDGTSEPETVEDDGPEVIEPDEFGELEDYDQVYLTYYDGVLADDRDEVIEDVDNVVGTDSLSQIGKYAEDTVHVRNDFWHTYYEILRDKRNYADVVN